jgi:hypothetical protein
MFMEPERSNAAFVGYALARALLDELDDDHKKRVVQRALSYLPPRADPREKPVDAEIYDRASTELKTLGGL